MLDGDDRDAVEGRGAAALLREQRRRLGSEEVVAVALPKRRRGRGRMIVALSRGKRGFPPIVRSGEVDHDVSTSLVAKERRKPQMRTEEGKRKNKVFFSNMSLKNE